jgi:hypothetical protein
MLTPHSILIHYYSLIRTYPLFTLTDSGRRCAAYVSLWTLLTYITYPLETLRYLLSSVP